MGVSVDRLTKIYGQQRAVDNLTFDAPKGKVTGFLGPNGAGKSTTMKIATGYLDATQGEVWVNDIPVSRDPVKVKKLIGYLPEHNPLYLEMYVREFLIFIAKAYGLRRKLIRDRVTEMVGVCGLEEEAHKKIKMLSKGFRQRVGLAKALLPDPEILILDEPTSGLDPNQIVEIRQVIKSASEDKTVILSTHIMQEVEAICDKVVIIDKGKLVTDSSLADLKESKSDSTVYSVTFEEDVNVELIEKLKSVNAIESLNPGQLRVEASSEKFRKEIIKHASDHQLPLVSVRKEGQSLEEIFQSLTESKEVGS